MYWQNFEPKQFIYEKIHNSYPKKDYHRMYFGEILHAYGTIQYLEQQ
jgi:hypothetical protein